MSWSAEGELLGFAIQHVNLDPSIYADPHHFDIDRFLEPRNEHKKAGRMFLAWGNGRHPCQGTRFANIVVRYPYGLSDLAIVQRAIVWKVLIVEAEGFMRSRVDFQYSACAPSHGTSSLTQPH